MTMQLEDEVRLLIQSFRSPPEAPDADPRPQQYYAELIEEAQEVLGDLKEAATDVEWVQACWVSAYRVYRSVKFARKAAGKTLRKFGRGNLMVAPLQETYDTLSKLRVQLRAALKETCL